MLILFALGSLVGATLLNFFTTLPQLDSIAGISTLGVLISGGTIWFANKNILRMVLMIILGALLGFGWAFFQAHKILSWQLPESDKDHIIEIAGKVTGITQWYDHMMRFDVDLSHYRSQPLAVPVKIRIFWKNATQQLADGDKIDCLVKLRPPWHLANPGSFDQEKQYFIEGIRATGKLISLRDHHAVEHQTLASMRQKLNDQMARLLREKPFLGVIQATTLGLYQNITPVQWQVFQATGTSHAIAISGLHVTLVAMLCSSIVSVIASRFVFLTLLFPAKVYGAIAAMTGALTYAAIAGFSIPTQRSLIMIMVAMLALLKRQPIFSWHSLALAWLGIGIVDPLAPLQMGFWLSFGSVAALIYGGSHVGESRWRRWIMPQFVVFIGIGPLCVLFFQQVALLSPLANIIALPLINIVVVPASLLGLLSMGFSHSLAGACLWVANQALEYIWKILKNIAQISFGLWQIGQVSWYVILLSLMGAVLLLMPSGFPGRLMGWFAFLPLIFYQPPALKSGEYKFTLLDVGQGLAAVIQTQHHTLLYDAGPQYGNHSDAGGRVIKPFLLTQRIKTLDKVIISHSDLDHRAGLKGLQGWPMKEVYSSEPERLSIPAKQCIAGERWEWEGVQFVMLGPTHFYKKRNNLSCVLKIFNDHHSVLLAGDIEQTAEEDLLTSYPHFLASTILVVPHHGSLTSSSQVFVEKVSPQYAIYPVGLGNRYGFPKATVIKRYERVGSKNLLVSETGALMFYLNRQGHLTPPIRWRDTSRRYWHSQIKSGEIR